MLERSKLRAIRGKPNWNTPVWNTLIRNLTYCMLRGWQRAFVWVAVLAICAHFCWGAVADDVTSVGQAKTQEIAPGPQPAEVSPQQERITQADDSPERPASAGQARFPDLAAERLAKSTIIVRDEYGVAHVSGRNTIEAVFALAYAQAEDFFWQIEDSYILGLGRYAEIHGPTGLNSDLLNRAFEIARKSREDFPKLDQEIQQICIAYANGLNYFLQKHPETRPRLIQHFEPWHVIAFGRQIVLETTFRYTRLHSSFVPRSNERIWSESGSNAWAIGTSRTRNGSTILLANPHQPWFGFGQLCEVHLRGEDDGMNFIGASLYGSPLPTMGHNDRLGWTLTTNEPDIADVWIERFNHPHDPLLYFYNGSYQAADEWTETIRVRRGSKVSEEQHTFRKTRHGPVVAKKNDQEFLSANIAGLHDCNRLHQLLHMMRARNLSQFEAALDLNEFNMMNVLYADADGMIGYYYTGAVPRRKEGFNWSEPVDGTNPKFDWGELHAANEFPRLVNPKIGYLQNCNSSPFVTTSNENPFRAEFADYMIEDADDDRRRAKRSRQVLEESYDFDLEKVSELAFDTTMYWATEQIPKLAALYQAWEAREPQVAKQLKPYVDHLIGWDGVVTADSTQATLCEAWYFEMHSSDYPGEEMLPGFANSPRMQIQALGRAALKLSSRFGDWKVPWEDVFRIQRVEPVADFLQLGFDDKSASLPCLAVPGQLGAIFTQYYSPYVDFPVSLVKKLEKRYGVVGTSYLAVWEFLDGEVRGASLVQFGASGDLDSRHAFDQAELLSERRFKPELFSWDDVANESESSYHPADR